MEERTVRDFTEDLAGSKAVPGGGAAAAVTGSMAAALASMVSELTKDKKKYEAYAKDVERIARHARKLSEQLLLFADKDAEKFTEVSMAYAMKPVTEVEKAEKADRLEAALAGACEPPMGMLTCLRELADLLEELSVKGSRLLVSDTGAGAVLAEGAARVSILAVYANTKLMHDRKNAMRMEQEAEAVLSYILESTEKTYRSTLMDLSYKG